MARLLTLISILATTIFYPSSIYARDTGVINGSVSHHPGDRDGPFGATVTLLVSHGNENRSSVQTSLSDANEFQFSGLSTDPTFSYIVIVEHQEGLFPSERLVFTQNDMLLVEVPIFNTTLLDPGMRTEGHSILLAARSNRTITAIHTITIELPGDKALLVGQETVSPIEFGAPENIVDFQTMDGFDFADLKSGASGFSVGMTLTPGTNNFTYAYSFPWEPGGHEFPVTTIPDVGALRILAPVDNLLVEGNNVRRGENVALSGMAVTEWYIDVPELEIVHNVRLRDPTTLPAVAFIGGMESSMWAGIGAGVFVIVLAISIWRNPSHRNSTIRTLR